MKLIVIFAVLFLAGCSSQAFCQKSKECDPRDNNDDDFVDVCAKQEDGLLDALRANKEQECKDLASAINALNGCEGALECADFTAVDDNGKCAAERGKRDDACQAIHKNDVDCESLLAVGCAVGP